MTAFYIALSSLFELTAIVLLLWGFFHEEKVARWEQKQWTRFKRWLRKQLRKSKRIVAWAEKPAKHGKPDFEWIEGQIKVFGDVWK